jgi:elongation factor P
MEFLYNSEDEYHFMNSSTYEQIVLNSEALGDAVNYLKPNLHVMVEFYEGNPMGVSLPKTVDLEVTQTDPALKSATVTNVLKPATVETGAIVQVPGFVAIGDVIRVDTESGEYLSRTK